jgi:glycosyltransferase involved in cell wall biosynthesis
VTAPWLIVAGDLTVTGGMDKANYHLALYLAEVLGRQVHLVAHQVAPPLDDHPRVRVHRVPRPLGRHALGGPLLDFTGRRVARRLGAAGWPAHVVVNGGNCLYPAVNWVHMVQQAGRCWDAGSPWVFRLKNRWARGRERARERTALALSRMVLANSEKTRRELIDLVGVPSERIRVVYLGAESETSRAATPGERRAAREALQLPAEAPVVLFVGALGYDRNKGFDTLLRAWRRLAQEGQALPLLIAVGDGNLGFWQRQVDRFGLKASVRLLGHTNRMAELMAAVDLLVSPTRYDAYGLAVHEALCRGVPALVSSAAGVSERYPSELHDLVLPDPEDVGDLTARLGRCFQDLAGYRRRVEPLSRRLRARTWSHVAQEIIDMVEAGLPAPQQAPRSRLTAAIP